MALGITIQRVSVFGNKRIVTADLTFSGTYPPGGEALGAALLGLSEIDLVLPSGKSGYILEYDYVNAKMKVLNPRAAISNTLAVSPHPTGSISVTSNAASMADHTLSGVAGVAAGAGAEYSGSLSLSDVRIIAVGY